MSAGGSSIVSEHKNSGKEDLEHWVKVRSEIFHPGQLITGLRKAPAHLIVDSDAQQFPGWKVQFNDLE